MQLLDASDRLLSAGNLFGDQGFALHVTPCSSTSPILPSPFHICCPSWAARDSTSLEWDIQEAFKNLKGDLAIRSVFHQKEQRIEAHIFIAFLADCLQIALQRRACALAPGLTARSPLDKFAAVQMIEVHLPTTDGRELVLTRYTQPERQLQLLINQLKLVVPPQPPPRITAAARHRAPSMQTALLRYGMRAIILVGAALSTMSPCGAFAETPRAVVVAADLRFPEGTIFVGQDLYFVDYARSDVLHLVGAKTEVVWHQDGCGANGLVTVPGGLLVACFDGGEVVKISLGGATLTTIRRDTLGQALVAPNDLTGDQKGGLYLSDSGSSNRPGKVFYLGGNGVVREVASGIRFANGVGVSPDGATLYVAESPTGKVLAFPISADGSLGTVRDFIRLRDVLPASASEAVTPDSLRVDRHGNVFVALYKGGGVAIVSPAGQLLTLLDVPSEHHTNLAISPDGASLYITAIDDDAHSTYRGQIVRMVNPLAP